MGGLDEDRLLLSGWAAAVEEEAATCIGSTLLWRRFNSLEGIC